MISLGNKLEGGGVMAGTREKRHAIEGGYARDVTENGSSHATERQRSGEFEKVERKRSRSKLFKMRSGAVQSSSLCFRWCVFL